MTTLMQVLRQLGFRINYNKVIEPTQRLIFLGVTLTSNTMLLSLPQAKCNELKALIHKFMTNVRVTKKQLCSLAGKLSWASVCIYGGRYHLRRIFDRINTLAFIITAHASLRRYVLILTGGLATWTAIIIVSPWWISARHPQSLLTRVRKQVVHITLVMPCTLLGIYTAIRYIICLSTIKRPLPWSRRYRLGHLIGLTRISTFTRTTKQQWR